MTDRDHNTGGSGVNVPTPMQHEMDQASAQDEAPRKPHRTGLRSSPTPEKDEIPDSGVVTDKEANLEEYAAQVEAKTPLPTVVPTDAASILQFMLQRDETARKERLEEYKRRDKAESDRLEAVHNERLEENRRRDKAKSDRIEAVKRERLEENRLRDKTESDRIKAVKRERLEDAKRRDEVEQKRDDRAKEERVEAKAQRDHEAREAQLQRDEAQAIREEARIIREENRANEARKREDDLSLRQHALETSIVREHERAEKSRDDDRARNEEIRQGDLARSEACQLKTEQ